MAGNTTKTIVDYVWLYYEKGFSIIPLGSMGNLKAPSLNEWRQYQEKRATKEEIQKWIDDGLFVGIGIIGGSISNNLAVIDFDDDNIPKEIGLKLDKIQENGNWVVKTGKGYHIYCRDSKSVKTRKVALCSMDLKAEGGYVVAPPSMHESGNKYSFMNKELGEIPIQKVDELFDDIITKIKKKRGIKAPKAKQINEKENTPPCISIMKEGAEPGRRNETVYCLASYYKNIKKMALEDTQVILSTWNDEKNTEKLPETELNATILSAYEATTQKGCTSIRDLGYCPYDDDNQCPFFAGNKQSNELLQMYGVLNEKGGLASYVAMAKLIKAEHDYNFTVVRDESTDKKTIYSYYDGYYHHDGKDMIKRLVTNYLVDKATIKAKDEVISALIDMSDGCDRGTLEPSKRYINFKNGVYDLETGKLSSHSPEKHFLQKIPIQYIPNAKCPKIIKFISEIARPDEIPIIQEMFGYCLYRSYDVSAVFILFGTGRNGKSVLLKLLRKMIGAENICSRKLHEITSDPFAKADLYGRLANICGEMEGHTIKETGNLKELTGEDWVTAQRKYHGSFQFQNYAKLIFSTNQVPKTNDGSFGLYDRVRIINFTKVFNSGDPKTNVNLYDEISTDEEMEGLLLWAIEGLKRLLNHNAISGSEGLADMGTAYEDAVNYEWDWLRDNVKVSSNFNEFLSTDDINKAFEDWCLRNDKARVPKHTFARKVRGYIKTHGGREGRTYVNGVRIRGYSGASFQTDTTEGSVTHDEPEGMMKSIKDVTPAKKEILVEMFGQESIDQLINQGILIKLPNGKMELDI